MHKNTVPELIGGQQFVWLANVDSQSRSTRFVAASQYAFMNVGPW